MISTLFVQCEECHRFELFFQGTDEIRPRNFCKNIRHNFFRMKEHKDGKITFLKSWDSPKINQVGSPPLRISAFRGN